ncbi:MAG: 6-phosphogluconolactonase [candidate division NC10 bacterium]|nr:6-phosphogluconolactonase [candidate division NC10 bacterium]
MDMTPTFGREGLQREFVREQLHILQYENRDLLGQSAAQAVADLMRQTITARGRVRMVFASAMSQVDFLKYLGEQKDIAWRKVFAFHLDNYKDFPSDHAQSFSQFLVDRLFSRVPGVHFFPINSKASDPDAEVRRYTGLLTQDPIDIMILGIGESGHLAFIDPEFCDFHDPQSFKVTDLDQQTREQLIHDGCFKSLDEVPRTAYSMTIPACLGGTCTIAIVPTVRKAKAIQAVVEGPITPKVPASILRSKENAWLLIDKDSGGLLGRRTS